jgi:hypothetical protein
VLALPHDMDVIVMLQKKNSSTCNKILKQFNNVDVWIGEHYLFAVNANITIHYQIEGGAFRSEEFIQERGAPCPMEFTLSADERGEK